MYVLRFHTIQVYKNTKSSAKVLKKHEIPNTQTIFLLFLNNSGYYFLSYINLRCYKKISNTPLLSKSRFKSFYITKPRTQLFFRLKLYFWSNV